MSLINSIIDRKNLLSAWLKVKRELLNYEGYVDIKELYSFEASLDKNLDYIYLQFSKKQWNPKKMIPLPRLKMKKIEDEKYEERIRQDFWVPLIDQVAWVAVVNIIGPMIDLQMPAWSFGYRLYRPTWYQDGDCPDEDDKSRPGPYRHSNGLIYRPWHRSWSLYRRLAHYTWISMRKGAKTKRYIEMLPEVDQKTFNSVTDDKIKDYSWRLVFLNSGYWSRKSNNIYFAKIDFADFYPTLSRDSVLKGLIFGLRNSENYIYDNKELDLNDIERLLKQMLNFSWEEPNWLEPEKEWASISKRDTGIPVGLLVSGFLANCALLPIDVEVGKKLSSQEIKHIAHFRYVDDHVILSNNFQGLLDWLQSYKQMVQELGVEFSLIKIEPKELSSYFKKNITKDILVSSHREKFIVDNQNPKQFFTQTLALVSDLANTDLGLLDSDEQKSLLTELLHLLKTPLQEDEIKNDTRMTFAIHRIIRLMIDWQDNCFSKQVNIGTKNVSIADNRLKKCSNPEEYKTLLRATFSHLIETINLFPDKLRLWKSIVYFCRNTGYEGWREIKKIFKAKGNKRQYRFLKVLIWQELGKQVIEASKEVKYYNRLYSWELDEQMRFVATIGNWLQAFPKDEKTEGYENITWDYLNNSVKLAKHIIDNKILEEFSSNDSAWLYWAETNLATVNSSEPSNLWFKNINRLDVANDIDKSLMLMYPRQLSEVSLAKFNQILSVFKKKRTGWEWEGKRFTRRVDKRIDLLTWCDFTKELEERYRLEHVYDPRISEWTCLEIVRQVLNIFRPTLDNIKKLRAFSRRNAIVIHPINFDVPETWLMIKEGEIPSWESWIDNVRRDDVVKLRSKDNRVNFDNRYAPFSISYDTTIQDSNINNILYGSGLLLLGLLKRNFIWPSYWHLAPYSHDWKKIARHWFDLSACSSSTLSILEALLVARNLESKIIKTKSRFTYKYYMDDTLYDPVSIFDLKDLDKRICSAQLELEQHQISSFKIYPRQLIPVKIPDLLKRKWLNIND